jgi:hypothetical protein
VREDATGASYVQFGDGETGARLPSGLNNVVARYRTGAGAFGLVKPGATPSAGQRLEGLDKVQLPGAVSGGAAPEAADKAREAAPGKIQSLGRMVSLRDFETEALGIPGVTTVTAAWALHDGVPAVVLTVLLAAGRETEFTDVRAIIAGYQRCRSADRFPIVVREAFLRYAFLDVAYSFDPQFMSGEVESGLRDALGLVGDDAQARTGLFGLAARTLGQIEYASRIEGTLQNVPGVRWCKVTAFGLFPAGVSDPATLTLASAPRPLAAQLVGGDNELLQLHPLHLTLASAPADATEDCAS